jgi:hypothetical protein
LTPMPYQHCLLQCHQRQQPLRKVRKSHPISQQEFLLYFKSASLSPADTFSFFITCCDSWYCKIRPFMSSAY